MSDVVCFGEILLRLSTQNYQRLATAPTLEVTFGGAEANVAAQLSSLDVPSAFVTRLPEGPIADRCLSELQGLGVNVQHVRHGGNRMGLYFLEPGMSQRPTNVIYDRQHSAISEATPGMFDWEKIFAPAKWFHWSGITPALSKNTAAICKEACIVAKKAGLTVSFDVNFRSKLWSEADAAAVIQPLMQYVDVCVCGEGDAVSVLGATKAEGDEEQRLTAIATELAKKYDFQTVAMTCRNADRADQTAWRGTLLTGGKVHHSRNYDITIVDRVGAGDSFTGTLIYALIKGITPARAIELAVASSALKHTIPGDYNRVSLAEIEALVDGSGGGRVRR